MQRNNPDLMQTQLRIGDRIRLVLMPQDPDPIPAGTKGVVTAIHIHNGWTQIGVSWENGRKLMLVSPPDIFEIIEGDR